MINTMQLRHIIGKPLPPKPVRSKLNLIQTITEGEQRDPEKALKEISKIVEEMLWK